MSVPGIAVPGSVVIAGSAVSPAGPQGIQGPAGPGGGGTGGSGTKTWRRFNANDGIPPTAAYALWSTRNANPVLAFDPATAWSILFIDIVPEAAVVTSGVLIRIFWMADTAVAGAVQWGAQIDHMTAGNNPLVDSFDTPATAFNSTNTTTAGIVTVTSITLTTIDSIAIGDGYRLKIYRDAASANDTMLGNALLLAVEIRSAN